VSYDLIIRSDDACSEQVDLASIHSFLAGLSGMSSPNGIDCIWGGTGPYHMELFLEFVGPPSEQGVKARQVINCIACHIPYAFLDPDDVDPAAYFRVCLRIAAIWVGGSMIRKVTTTSMRFERPGRAAAGATEGCSLQRGTVAAPCGAFLSASHNAW
jgi:hypothetical protein